MKKLFFILSAFICLSVSAQPGVIMYDNTFGRFSGSEFTQLGQGTFYDDMAIQQDGKPVCAGYYSNGAFIRSAVVRYKTNGEFDSSFGINGIAVPFLENDEHRVMAMKLQPDEKIVVVGYTTTDFLLARYKTDGHPDSSFGTNGYVTRHAGWFYDILQEVELQPDGKIIAAGVLYEDMHYVFAALRYNADGTPDSSLGGNGLVTIQANMSHSECRGLAVQPDGKILLAGFSGDTDDHNIFTVVRLKTDGSPDSSFGTNGIAYPPSPGVNEKLEDIVVLPGGKILAVGESLITPGSRSDVTLVQLDSTGVPDPGFGTGGISQVNLWNSLSGLTKIALQPDGKIIGTGWISSQGSFPGDVILLRFNTGGTLDTYFDTDGFIGNAGSDPDNTYTGNTVALSGARVYVAGNGTPFNAPSPGYGFISAILNVGSPVPVHVLSFDAVRKTTGVQLRWEVTDNSLTKFIAERSSDGIHFTAVATIDATNNSSYSCTDASVMPVTSFYRLQMIKQDGSYAYSVIVKVPGTNAPVQLSVYPNPVKDMLSLSVSGIRGEAVIRILNAAGTIVQERKINLHGNAALNFDASKLPAGNYFLSLYSPQGWLQEKFIKL